MTDDERTMEVPTDEDENIGDLPKKKTKRKKSKEERQADRKVVFWTLVVIIGITLLFWIWPKAVSIFSGRQEGVQFDELNEEKEGKEWKNYIEYDL